MQKWVLLAEISFSSLELHILTCEVILLSLPVPSEIGRERLGYSYRQQTVSEGQGKVSSSSSLSTVLLAAGKQNSDWREAGEARSSNQNLLSSNPDSGKSHLRIALNLQEVEAHKKRSCLSLLSFQESQGKVKVWNF